MKKVIMMIVIAAVMVAITGNMTDEHNPVSDYISEVSQRWGANSIKEIVASGESKDLGIWFAYIDAETGHRWLCSRGNR